MAFIAASADRVSAHGLRWGVEPTCRALSAHGLQTGPSTYYAHRSGPASARSLRDAELLVEIKRVHGDRQIGRGLYGARKVWQQLLREGFVVPRCHVERLMKSRRAAGSFGAVSASSRPSPTPRRPGRRTWSRATQRREAEPAVAGRLHLRAGLELATLSWVHWFNGTRLHSSLGHVPPLEYEAEHYRHIAYLQQPLPGELSLH